MQDSEADQAMPIGVRAPFVSEFGRNQRIEHDGFINVEPVTRAERQWPSARVVAIGSDQGVYVIGGDRLRFHEVAGCQRASHGPDLAWAIPMVTSALGAYGQKSGNTGAADNYRGDGNDEGCFSQAILQEN